MRLEATRGGREALVVSCGTDSTNPLSSSKESGANSISWIMLLAELKVFAWSSSNRWLAFLTRTHYRRGWHITATCGIFGAAAACARQSRRVTVRCRFTANGNAIRGRRKHAAHPVRSSDRVEGCGAACFGRGRITHVRTGDTKR
jgi:hypothetical protein